MPESLKKKAVKGVVWSAIDSIEINQNNFQEAENQIKSDFNSLPFTLRFLIARVQCMNAEKFIQKINKTFNAI